MNMEIGNFYYFPLDFVQEKIQGHEENRYEVFLSVEGRILPTDLW